MDMIKRKKQLMMSQKDPNLIYEAYNLSFDGTNYINTGAYLFTQENINRDFEFIAEGIVADRQVSNSTILCAKHNGNAYGFMVRADNSTVITYNGTIFVKPKPNSATVIVRRVSGVISLSGVNIANPKIQFVNQVFDWPLVLGCAIDDDGTMYRYAKGTIEHVKIRWI